MQARSKTRFQIMNPLWPNAQPWDILLFIVVAVIVVWLKRRTIFQRGSGVTDVPMPEQETEHSPEMGRRSPANSLGTFAKRRTSP